MTGGIGGTLPWLTLLRDLSVKSALLLLAAWALAGGMRRASAAARHLVWLLTFAALLFLPLLSLALPPRPVPLLPAPAAPLVPVSLAAPPAAPPVAVLPAPAAAAPPATARPIAFGRPAPAPISPARAWRAALPAWPLLLGLLWLGGAGLAALPLGLGWIGAVRRFRRCPPVADPALLALAAEAGRQLGVRRSVVLRSGPSVAVPVTFGLIRPVVLLPEGAASWPAERLRVALLHELAHVRRGDWTAQTLARLACALFWHNPLVWPAARMLRAEAERACDDLVLSLGIPAPDYAQHLLAVAGALAGADRPLPLAVPMAGQAALESRLRAVLTARPRRAPSRRLAVLAFVLALIVLVPLAMLRPAARAARQTVRHTVLVAASLPSVIPALPPPAPAPSLTPPKAAGPSPAPPLPVPPIPSQPTPKGVPSMKLLTPVKTVALAALAAGLALPAAHAQATPAPPTAGTFHWSSVVLQHTKLKSIAALMPWRQGIPNPAGVKRLFFLEGNNSILVDATPAGLAQVQEVVKRLDVAPGVTPAAPSPPPHEALINFATQGEVTNGVGMLFQGSHRSYVIEPGVSGSVKLDLHAVPFDKALSTLVGANSEPLEWSVQDGIYHIRPRAAVADGKAASAAPRQVQLKFEWVSAAGAPNAASDKNVDTLTVVAEEGRKTQVSSRHLRNGTGGEETITVLARVKPGGVVTLDITEHSDTTAHVGETLSNVFQTTVSVKDGETGTVGGLTLASQPSRQNARRLLFVTPTIIHPAE